MAISLSALHQYGLREVCQGEMVAGQKPHVTSMEVWSDSYGSMVTAVSGVCKLVIDVFDSDGEMAIALVHAQLMRRVLLTFSLPPYYSHHFRQLIIDDFSQRPCSLKRQEER